MHHWPGDFFGWWLYILGPATNPNLSPPLPGRVFLTRGQANIDIKESLGRSAPAKRSDEVWFLVCRLGLTRAGKSNTISLPVDLAVEMKRP